MGKYEVVSECYIPVGSGFRYKLSGQVVTLSDDVAASLAEHVKPVDSGDAPVDSGEVPEQNPEPELPQEQPKLVDSGEVPEQNPEPEPEPNPEPESPHEQPRPRRVAKRNTPKLRGIEQPESVEQHVVEEVAGEVISNDGDPQAGDERVDAASD